MNGKREESFCVSPSHALKVSKMVEQLVVVALLLLVCSLVHLRLFKPAWKGQGLPLPPGPRGLPLLGATLDMFDASVRPWHRFEAWSKQYGAGSSAGPTLSLSSHKPQARCYTCRHSDRSMSSSSAFCALSERALTLSQLDAGCSCVARKARIYILRPASTSSSILCHLTQLTRQPMVFTGELVQQNMVLANIRGDDDAHVGP